MTDFLQTETAHTIVEIVKYICFALGALLGVLKAFRWLKVFEAVDEIHLRLDMVVLYATFSTAVIPVFVPGKLVSIDDSYHFHYSAPVYTRPPGVWKGWIEPFLIDLGITLGIGLATFAVTIGIIECVSYVRTGHLRLRKS